MTPQSHVETKQREKPEEKVKHANLTDRQTDTHTHTIAGNYVKFS